MIEVITSNDMQWDEKAEKYILPPALHITKLNELIEASNRQDRAIGMLLMYHPKSMADLPQADQGYFADVNIETVMSRG